MPGIVALPMPLPLPYEAANDLVGFVINMASPSLVGKFHSCGLDNPTVAILSCCSPFPTLPTVGSALLPLPLTPMFALVDLPLAPTFELVALPLTPMFVPPPLL